VSGELVAVIAVIVVAMVFDYTNGFHDAANAIATSVSTRALTPGVALLVAAIGNFIGAHFGANVARTVGDGLVSLPAGVASLGVVFAGVVGAIAWNLLTWYYGLPSSSSHALIGGLVGATLFATGTQVKWGNIGNKVVLPMVLSPFVGFILGALVMFVLLWTVKGLTVYGRPAAPRRLSVRLEVLVGARAGPGAGGSSGGPADVAVDESAEEAPAAPVSWLRRRVHTAVAPEHLNRFFRRAQVVSAAAMAVGHGAQDAAKTMGIIVLALYVGGIQDSPTEIPWWVYYSSATVLALGTYSGGWRIIRTLGRRIIHLGPPEGFAAETVASSVLFYTAFHGAPISTTQTITSAITGVGATKKLSAVRWGVAGNILVAWVLTFPGAGAIAGVVYLLVRPVF
jgi:inorganic phosphate transporter, PiT family